MTAKCPHGHPIEAPLDTPLGDRAVDFFEKHGGRPLAVAESECPTCIAAEERVASARARRGHVVDPRDPKFMDLWLAGRANA